mgnify:FL=1
MNKGDIRTSALFDCRTEYLRELFSKYEYPWVMLTELKEYIEKVIERGLTGYHLISEGVLVGEDVKIYPTATIEPPAVIGSGSVVRPGAYIRGSVITGRGCVIGNSSELKNCVLLDGVQAPHYNYIGDSVLGNLAHMGAGSICSNLKSDGRAVVIHGDKEYETGLRKLGAILADGADIGCGSVLNPGTVVGKNTSVYPLTPLRGVYPSDAIVKGTDTVVPREKR